MKKEEKKREKEGRRKRWTETVATRSFHGVRKDAATLSFPCSEDECKEKARVWDGARTCARIHVRGDRTHAADRAHRFDRNRSSRRVEARPLAALLSLSREESACINARTRRREHARKVEAKARQSVDALMWPTPPLPSPP